MLAYSIPLDGIAGTFNLKESLGKPLILRLIYSPLQTIDTSYPFKPIKANYGTVKTTHGMSLMLEYSDKLSFVEDLSFLVQNVTILQNGVMDQNYRMTYRGQRLTGTLTSDPNLGTANWVISYLELINLMNTNFDFYLGHKYSYMHPRGFIYFQPDGFPIAFNTGGFFSDGINDAHGHNIISGAKYTLPIKSKTQLGIEYIYGSQNSISFGGHDDQRIGFYMALRGNGYHSYINQPLFQNAMNIRLGYFFIDRTHDDLLLGAPSPTDANIHNIYILCKMRF
jgi:hypothetical protein